MAFRRIQPGEPFRPTARAWNATLDAAEAHRRADRLGAATAQAAAELLVRNDAAKAVPRGGVLQLSQPAGRPIDVPRWLDRPAVAGALADSATGTPVVALEPIAPGQFGRAVAHGLAVARVAITDETHQAAALQPSALTLTSVQTGPVRLLWASETSGEAWGLIVLGSPVAEVMQSVIIPVKLWTDGGFEGDENTAASWTYTARTLEATAIDTGGELLGESLTPQKRRPDALISAPPDGSIGTGYRDAAGDFHLFDANEVPVTNEECT